ncbi:type I restriction enzyme S subunit [Modicisalibacter xianhensis]|uniref:Type I restriction enzyme S subunit n=1 Tax=Modicisalibacter xianhensis TaxID=442341 RepID=A0A4V3GTA8_9GAMM|nr:restriction endonuclease subunit S [Halomonas xianhensis]TDX26033.1 type I restriction enzyme S subunit [Halomonas xianhensis]
MSHYKPFPAYKDSGVTWLGQVPEHWEVKPICRVASVNDDSLSENTRLEERIRYVDISSVNYTAGITQAMAMEFSDAPSRARRKAVSGDVIVSTVRTYLKAVAAVTDEYEDCIFSTGFAVLRARQLNSSFLKWMMLNDLLVQAIEAHSEGLSYPAINASALIKLKSIVPPPEEQTKITAVLDREAARIDALIEKKTRFIELLKEKRQALIAHAVTKGLNPNVKMKDSGVEWIGQVPEHWRVVPSTWLFVESKERAHEDDQHLSATQKYGVISLAEYERLEGRQVTHAVKNLEQRKHVELDDFVISMRSFQGGIERVKARGCVRSSYVVIQAEDGADKNYFAYLFKSGSYIQGLQATSSFIRDGQDLNYGNFRQVRLPQPSLDEQMQIAKFLDQKSARIDALARTTEHSVTLLKERRAAFITAAVTGQIDLRGEQ